MKSQTTNLRETRSRSIVKGLVWRGLASLATFILVFAFTQKPVIALEVSALEIVIKLLLYYGHERAWNLIMWGRIPRRMTNDEARINDEIRMTKLC